MPDLRDHGGSLGGTGSRFGRPKRVSDLVGNPGTALDIAGVVHCIDASKNEFIMMVGSTPTLAYVKEGVVVREYSLGVTPYLVTASLSSDGSYLMLMANHYSGNHLIFFSINMNTMLLNGIATNIGGYTVQEGTHKPVMKDGFVYFFGYQGNSYRVARTTIPNGLTTPQTVYVDAAISRAVGSESNLTNSYILIGDNGDVYVTDVQTNNWTTTIWQHPPDLSALIRSYTSTDISIGGTLQLTNDSQTTPLIVGNRIYRPDNSANMVVRHITLNTSGTMTYATQNLRTVSSELNSLAAQYNPMYFLVSRGNRLGIIVIPSTNSTQYVRMVASPIFTSATKGQYIAREGSILYSCSTTFTDFRRTMWGHTNEAPYFAEGQRFRGIFYDYAYKGIIASPRALTNNNDSPRGTTNITYISVL